VFQGAIRARDVRAADLQEEPTKRLKDQSWFFDTVVSSDPTKTAAPGEHRSERSERLDTASLTSEAIRMDKPASWATRTCKRPE